MIPALALTAAVVLGSPGAPPRSSLSVSPAQVALEAGGRAVVRIATPTGGRLVLRAGVAGLALDLRGKPRIAARRDAAPWLSVSPPVVDVGPTGATVVIRARSHSSARPGDHTALLLLTTTVRTNKGVPVQLRVGVVVTVRVNGRRVHRVEVTAVRGRRAPQGHGRLIDVTLANRGNVIESIGGPGLRIIVLRHGRPLARLTVARRKVLPHTIALVTVRYRGRSHGATRVLVVLVGPAGRVAARSFALRL